MMLAHCYKCGTIELMLSVSALSHRDTGEEILISTFNVGSEKPVQSTDLPSVRHKRLRLRSVEEIKVSATSRAAFPAELHLKEKYQFTGGTY